MKPYEELKTKDILLPRNPVIAKLFRMVKLAENAGFGFDKIESNWVANNHTQQEYMIEFDSIVLKMNIEESVEKILRLVNNNSQITIEELTSAIDRTTRTIEMQIQKLKGLGKIERVGPDKGGYWKVNLD